MFVAHSIFNLAAAESIARAESRSATGSAAPPRHCSDELTQTTYLERRRVVLCDIHAKQLTRDHFVGVAFIARVLDDFEHHKAVDLHAVELGCCSGNAVLRLPRCSLLGHAAGCRCLPMTSLVSSSKKCTKKKRKAENHQKMLSLRASMRSLPSFTRQTVRLIDSSPMHAAIDADANVPFQGRVVINPNQYVVGQCSVRGVCAYAWLFHEQR